MPRAVLIGRRNWLDQELANVSGGRWVSDWRVLRDPRPQVVMQALSPAPEDTQFTVDFGAQRNNVGLIHFQRLNVTPGATIRVRAGLDPTFAATTYDSGIVTGWPKDKAAFSISPWGETTVSGVYDQDEYVAYGMPRYFIPPAPIVARYVLVEIWDTTSSVPAQIGCFGACETWEPQHSMDFGWSTTFLDEADILTAAYGSRYIIPRGKRRKLSLGFSWIGVQELTDRALGWVAMVGKSEPVVIVPLPDDTANLEKRAVYGLITDDVVIDNPFYAQYRMPLVLEQLI